MKDDETALSRRISLVSLPADDGRSFVSTTTAISTEENSNLKPIEMGQSSPQLTVKALVVGIIIGSFNAVLALYYSLRTGVNPSLNVLAGLGGFMLMKWGIVSGTFTVQENAVIQTCAVATYSLAAGAGFASGLLAMTQNVYEKVGDITGNNRADVIELTWLRGVGWGSAVALFGFFIAFPLRENMIIKQQLQFPSGTATALMIRTLHTSKEAAKTPWNLIVKSCSIGYIWLMFLYLFEGIRSFPIFGLQAFQFSWLLEFGPGIAAIGLMLPFHVITSMFVGSLISFALLGPFLAFFCQGPVNENTNNWFEGSEYDGLKAYTVLPAITIIVVDAIYSLIKVSISILKAVKVKGKENRHSSRDQEQEFLTRIFTKVAMPNCVWILGLPVFGVFSIFLLSVIYPVEWYQLLLAISLTPIFSIGVIQGVGLTDMNVASAIGKLSMFVFGCWSSESIIPPLVLCQALIVGCIQAADLMQDFKTGYLVGASPRSMFIAQFIGALMSIFIVPTVWVLMDSAYTIPGDIIKAPYGEVYRSLAILSVQGLNGLPPYCGYFMLIFGIWAIVTLILTDLRIFKMAPLPMAVAIGMIGPPFVALEGLLVAILGKIWEYQNPTEYLTLRYVLASGMMAGEGLFVMTEIFFTFIGVHPPMMIKFK